MVVLAVLTLWATSWLHAYILPESDDMLVAAFFDALFGGAVAAMLVYTEKPKCAENKGRSNKYYGIILCMFLFTSVLNVVAWTMSFYGVYEGSALKANFANIVLTANIIQALCLIEGGYNGLKNIITSVYHSFVGLHWNNSHKDSHDKIDGKRQ
jgi:drug/metabolite transporter (DMT)-like permease